MKKLDQSGLTSIEVLLIIITIILAIGVGYYMYSSNKINDSIETRKLSTVIY